MKKPTSWTPALKKSAGPLYHAITNALENDIANGKLRPGELLPTQRELAKRLGVAFTTITRAYAEARKRGLIRATVGRGTFVTSSRSVDSRDEEANASTYNLSINTPPIPAWMYRALTDTLVRVSDDETLIKQGLSYESAKLEAAINSSGLIWLASRRVDANASQVVVTNGAQHALSVLFTTLAKPGDTVLVEALAYPGTQSAAASSGVNLIGVEMDDEGILPDALDALCTRHKPKAIMCVPTLQNPTTAVMSLSRRHEIIAVAARHNVRIVEDDICGPLLADAPPPLAALAPDVCYYIGSISKCVAPGLRVAFVACPTTEDANRLRSAVNASVLMLSPLPLAVACDWINNGTAARAVNSIRAEAVTRGALIRSTLGNVDVRMPRGSLHAWLQLPTNWTVAAFVAEALRRGVRVAPAEWYITPISSVTPRATPHAVRLTVGQPVNSKGVESALTTLASILAGQPTFRTAQI
ncbi:MAG: PLP-dependent aminotransferase family protein [Gemmatimonadaceae bacterium]